MKREQIITLEMMKQFKLEEVSEREACANHLMKYFGIDLATVSEDNQRILADYYKNGGSAAIMNLIYRLMPKES
jgi:hypothetical protein